MGVVSSSYFAFVRVMHVCQSNPVRWQVIPARAVVVAHGGADEADEEPDGGNAGDGHDADDADAFQGGAARAEDEPLDAVDHHAEAEHDVPGNGGAEEVRHAVLLVLAWMQSTHMI